jgi:hypothetical protein
VKVSSLIKFDMDPAVQAITALSKNGMLTPEPSVGPDDDRNKSERSRVQGEAAEQAKGSNLGAEDQTQLDNPSTSSDNDQEANGKKQQVDGSENAATPVAWSQAQADAITRILNARDTFYFEILGLPNDLKESPPLVIKRYRELSTMIHPDRCKHPDAGKAMTSECFTRCTGTAN